MDKDEYILRRMTKIGKKRWEFFVISRVIHKLDDPEIEFVTQQLVRRPEGKRALTDMYFPQFALHLEIDEGQHYTDDNAESDRHRTEDIVSVTDHDIVRIAAAERTKDGIRPLSLEVVKADIDEFVGRLQRLKTEKSEDGSFEPWNFEHQYRPERHFTAGLVDCSKSVILRKQKYALKLFGYSGGEYQRGAWKIPDGSGDLVWFPRLYEQDGWDNDLSHDGKTIFERPKTKQAKETIKRSLKTGFDAGNRIVFARIQNSLGQTLYRYVGTFCINLECSNSGQVIYNRVKTIEPIRYITSPA